MDHFLMQKMYQLYNYQINHIQHVLINLYDHMQMMENVLMNWSHILSASMKNAAAVETLTAADKLGGGWAGKGNLPRAVASVVHDVFAPLLLGRDPLEIENHWNNMFSLVSFCGSAGAEMRAISAQGKPARFQSAPRADGLTAKPCPASPARAASTAALSARMFVWKAISLIVLIMWATWSEAALEAARDRCMPSTSDDPLSAS